MNLSTQLSTYVDHKVMLNTMKELLEDELKITNERIKAEVFTGY